MRETKYSAIPIIHSRHFCQNVYQDMSGMQSVFADVVGEDYIAYEYFRSACDKMLLKPCALYRPHEPEAGEQGTDAGQDSNRAYRM